MLTQTLKTIVKENNSSLKTDEKAEKEAKKEYGNNWPAIMVTVKKILKNKDN